MKKANIGGLFHWELGYHPKNTKYIIIKQTNQMNRIFKKVGVIGTKRRGRSNYPRSDLPHEKVKGQKEVS